MFPPNTAKGFFAELKKQETLNPWLCRNSSDPERYTNPVMEGAGAVASDSLAAESAKSGGKFGENRNSEPLSVSGSSSTFNNTDTSGAITLDPAQKAADRSDDDNEYQPSGIRGGGTDDVTEEGSKGNLDSSSTETAPSYVSSVKSDPAQTGKPKGKNITEGGFDSDPSKNASFNNEIGTENDPGRAAEQKFANTAQSASGGTGPNQKMGDSGSSQYDVLQSEQNL